MAELSTQYQPADIERDTYQRWLDSRIFHGVPDDRDERYVVMMPLPNVTGALHMGHAMDNVMQDLLIRWHRMRGDNTLWMPGTDHAGIATQAVIEKRLLEFEGKTRHDIGREELVKRIWKWKDQYQKRIIEQQQAMGCSCDWDRQRFTMDPVCARAVRWTFFNLFRDGLIYRGNRLVNWDCHLETAVSDDEIVHQSVAGHFWHLRYPVIDPRPGEPEFVIVATTRPETMLGDTAVACHPAPIVALEAVIATLRERIETAAQKDRATLETELERVEARRESHLPRLEQLAGMAADGRQVMLPLQERAIPIIRDEWAKPELGSGCVKITPAHDPNDYEVWKRHQDEIGIINILNKNGTLNENAGDYRDLDRFDARKRVVADLDSRDLVESVEDRETEVGHSDRSKTPIEPFISEQWFLTMHDVDGGVLCGRGTPREHRHAGLAQAALDAVSDEWTSASGRQVTFHPERYRSTYVNWLAEKRDWCISRQLWWGHRIPIWAAELAGDDLDRVVTSLREHAGEENLSVRLTTADGTSHSLTDVTEGAISEARIEVCPRDEAADERWVPILEGLGLTRDPDVLDTWFSSGVWPHSTLGWPDPTTAQLEEGQPTLDADGERPDALSYYYPGSCLVTGRDIITLWIARMVLMGLYNLGDLPFSDVFIHATILDGNGERMSKSKGNGIDPVDIIERYGADAMRYVICEMQTGTQDVRLPVQVKSPFTGEVIDLASAKHGKSIFTYLDPKTGEEFDVLGSMPDLPSAKPYSERFEVGRNFCNKLWNATRFAMMNLEGTGFEARQLADLQVEDRWILSRLELARASVQSALEDYNPSAAIGAARDFFWGELCDWYLELIKPRMRDETEAPLSRQVLAAVMDQILRLLHPFVPFITEALWKSLGEIAPTRGIDEPYPTHALIAAAPWPMAKESRRDVALEESFTRVQEIVRAIRDLRNRYDVPPKTAEARLKVTPAVAGDLEKVAHLIQNMSGLATVVVGPDVERTTDSATAIVGDVEIYIPGAVDLEKERGRLGKQRDKVAKAVDGIRRKLANEGFLAKAKPEIVEEQRQRLATMESELKTIEASLTELA